MPLRRSKRIAEKALATLSGPLKKPKLSESSSEDPKTEVSDLKIQLEQTEKKLKFTNRILAKERGHRAYLLMKVNVSEKMAEIAESARKKMEKEMKESLADVEKIKEGVVELRNKLNDYKNHEEVLNKERIEKEKYRKKWLDGLDKAERKLEKELPCKICEICAFRYESHIPKRVPRVLGCGHTMCTECVGNLSNGQLQFRCPFDRLGIRLKSNGAEGLPKNFAILNQ